jgi:hypothetical protein
MRNLPELLLCRNRSAVIFAIISILSTISSAFIPSFHSFLSQHRNSPLMASSLSTPSASSLTYNYMGPMGNHDELPIGDSDDPEERMRRQRFNMNVGKAFDVLRREIPLVFAAYRPDKGETDFSIFADQITLIDGTPGRQRKMVMAKNMYVGAIKSLVFASSFSTIYPEVNLHKIEYVEDIKTIQCLVDVVLPESLRGSDGQVFFLF